MTQTAHKVWIGNVSNGNIMLNGDKFVSVEVANKQIARVNIIANVVDVYANEEKRFNTVTLDDSSGQIRVKGFSDNSFLLQGVVIGDTICVVGWLRHYNDELYVVPDIVRHLDSKWSLVRRLELIKMYGANKPMNKEEKVEASNLIQEPAPQVQQPSARDAIVSLIKKHEDGIDIEQLIMETNFPVEQINSIIQTMIGAGEAYEPMPGKIRAL